jgi:hypothetical protein
MLPLSIGIAMAVGFTALAGSTYGFEEIFSGSWPFLVVWGLIAGPVLMFVAGRGDHDSDRRGGRKA